MSQYSLKILIFSSEVFKNFLWQELYWIPFKTKRNILKVDKNGWKWNRTCLDFKSIRFNVLVAKGVQLGHPDPEVCRLEKILNLLGIRIESGTVDVDVRREHSVDDSSQSTWNNLWISRLADGFVQVPRSSFVSFRKWLVTFGGKIPSHLPRLTPVVRLLDVHGGRAEGLVGDDQVGDVKLGLEVELDGHVLHAVLRLPPGSILVSLDLAGGLPAVDDVRDAVGGPGVAP